MVCYSVASLSSIMINIPVGVSPLGQVLAPNKSYAPATAPSCAWLLRAGGSDAELQFLPVEALPIFFYILFRQVYAKRITHVPFAEVSVVSDMCVCQTGHEYDL